jgi:hypothetical protein
MALETLIRKLFRVNIASVMMRSVVQFLGQARQEIIVILILLYVSNVFHAIHYLSYSQRLFKIFQILRG